MSDSSRSKPLVSVSLITYNQAPYVRETLDGALRQETDFDYELVIGDDCSTDGTPEILKEYEEKYPGKIRLLLRDQNVGATRNFAENIQRCTGTYIAMLDGDDYWTDPFKLKKQVGFLEDHPEYSMCCTDFSIIDDRGSLVEEHGWDEREVSVLTQQTILERKTPKLFTVLFRRAALPETFPEEFFEVYNGDNFLAALITRDADAAYLDFISGRYRVHTGGIWSAMDKVKKNENALSTYLVMCRYFGREVEQKAIGKRIYKKYRTLFYLYLTKGHLVKAFKSLWSISRLREGSVFEALLMTARKMKRKQIDK